MPPVSNRQRRPFNLIGHPHPLRQCSNLLIRFFFSKLKTKTGRLYRGQAAITKTAQETRLDDDIQMAESQNVEKKLKMLNSFDHSWQPCAGVK
jgi:hypothetical protein